MKRAAAIITFFLAAESAKAQLPLCPPGGETGSVKVTGDPRLRDLIYLKKNEVGREQEMSGYRIQIFVGHTRNEALQAKSKFESQNPGESVYLTFDSPDFKVRVGDFRNRLEAQKLLHNVKAIYPGAFIVPAKIKFPKAVRG